MARYRKNSDNKFTLFADNGNYFKDPITDNVKYKLGSLKKFVNAARVSKNEFEAYLNKRSRKLQARITHYSWYWNIAIFLMNNSRVINFRNLHLVNSEPGYLYVSKDKRYWPRVPVYYRHIYTRNRYYTKYVNNDTELNVNKRVFALKYKPNFVYKNKNNITNEKDKTDYIKNERKQIYKCMAYEFCYQKIKQELKDILLSNHKIAVMDIPSSKANTETVLDKIIHEISCKNNNIINASDLLIRTKTKETSHTGKGTSNRSVLDNIKTLGLSLSNISKKALNSAEAFVIIDDITTTGASFIAVDKFIHDNQGKNGVLPNIPLVNFAYAKTVGNFYFTKDQSDLIKNKGLVKGIIFDIDNTLIDTNILVKEYHKYLNERSLTKFNQILRNLFNKNNDMAQLMQIISDLLSDGIKVSYVSNRGHKELNEILNCAIGFINNGNAYRQILPKDKIIQSKKHFFKSSPLVISSSARTDDTKPYSAKPKPGPDSIIRAVKQMGLSNNDRIIGLGNQESDMIAYKRAGVEPVLVDWFNKPIINPYEISNSGKALYTNPLPLIDYNKDRIKLFESVEDFSKWIKTQTDINSSNNTQSDDLPF